jgi:hypothetical protein
MAAISGSRRLHISPFTPQLLSKYLAPSVLPSASNISYHDLQAFPEKAYGFVDLPINEAEKLKKKLHGMTFKGAKVSIEDARNEKRKASSEDGTVIETKSKKTKLARTDDGKASDNVLHGVQLVDRKVKRGWTEQSTTREKDKNWKDKKDKKDKSKSKSKSVQKSEYTNGPEMLFKTKIPPNVASSASRESSKSKSDKRSKGSERVVHEFAKTTKHASFLRDSGLPKTARVATAFVEGKGWVEEDGNVIDDVVTKPKMTSILKHHSPKVVECKLNPAVIGNENFRISKLTTKTDSADSLVESNTGSNSTSSVSSLSGFSNDDSDDSGISDSESASDASDAEGRDMQNEATEAETTANTNKNAVPGSNLTIRIPGTEPSLESESEIHPLEAVFKRRKALFSPGAPAESSTFTFFEPDEAEEAEEVEAPSLIPPLTPFTARDMRQRNMRSPAPTPDTAAPWRKTSFPWSNEAHEEEGKVEDIPEAENDRSSPLGKKVTSKADISLQKPSAVKEKVTLHLRHGKTLEVDKEWVLLDPATLNVPEELDPAKQTKTFEEIFYETRGETNRAWKRRRRDALKERRKRENKKRPSDRH